MDPLTRASVTTSILNAREKLGETFVIVSHDMDFVQEICDRAAYINNGKIEAIGDPKDIISRLMTKESAGGAEKPVKPKTKKSAASDSKKTEKKTKTEPKASTKSSSKSKKVNLDAVKEKSVENENIEINTDGGCV